jgi:hypothetical protein
MWQKRALASAMIVLSVGSASHAAKYAGEFLSLGVGARPIALGGAYVAESGDLLSGYYNPAGLSSVSKPQAAFMHSETFDQLLNHDYLSYSHPMGDPEKQSALAISLYRLGGGGIAVTGRDQTGRFYVISEESHADYAGYFSYGRAFGQKLRAGVSAKLIYRDIIDESAVGLGLDIGTIASPWRWADFGINVQDATTTLLSYSTGTKESIYPTTKIGAKFHGEKGRFSTALLTDADLRFDGIDYGAQFATGPASIDSHLGLEISYMRKIAARIGSDAGNLTLGAGLALGRFNVDLAMRDHADLDNTFLVSLTAGF